MTATEIEPKVPPVNAFLDDEDVHHHLQGINEKFRDFCTRVAGEAWGTPLIDQRTKVLISLAVDVVNYNQVSEGTPFAVHVDMAFKQGITREEIEELLKFMCVYAGFNKAASAFATLNKICEEPSPKES